MARQREGAGRTKVLALAGGKGGVGTSLLAANLAVYLARQGREVVLLDAAPDGATLQAQLGLPFPPRHLGERLAGGSAPLAELLISGGVPNLRLLAGVPDRPSLPARPDEFGARLLQEAAGLPCDFVVADVGSGRSRAVRLACGAANTVLLVATPEPAALRGVLRLQASVLYSALEEALGPERAAELEPALGERGARAVLSSLKDEPAPHAAVLEALRRRSFGLLLNQVRSGAESECAARVGAALSMLQAVMIDPVMTLEFDLSVPQAVRERKVLSQRYPNAPVSRALDKLAFALTSPRASDSGRGQDRYAPLSTWHHYRLLALDPKATSREIQRHFERIRSPFLPGGESEAIASRERLDAILARIEAAYRTLIFLENRREYDRRLVETGVLQAGELRDLGSEVDATVDASDLPVQPVGAAAATLVTDSAPAPRPPRPGPPAPSSPAAASAPSPAAAAAAGPVSAAGPASAARPAAPAAGAPASPSPWARAGSSTPLTASAGAAGAAASQIPSADAAPPAGPPPGPLPGRHDRFSGALLRSLRRQRGLDIDRIGEVTKIRSHHILAIEDERYADLPVPVFLRGFLRAYAICLEVDPDDVVRDYMASYDTWSQARG